MDKIWMSQARPCRSVTFEVLEGTENAVEVPFCPMASPAAQPFATTAPRLPFGPHMPPCLPFRGRWSGPRPRPICRLSPRPITGVSLLGVPFPLARHVLAARAWCCCARLNTWRRLVCPSDHGCVRLSCLSRRKYLIAVAVAVAARVTWVVTWAERLRFVLASIGIGLRRLCLLSPVTCSPFFSQASKVQDCRFAPFDRSRRSQRAAR
ncbi:hypothetical protein B0T25DRAFT_543720 [Lasiosphaeria hispida]|uniref:Uncharacterized protein n=1 Tax=Lasiosphaeria hispida TaxID=260671 RepID=A0AAJ0ME47_9PEZI|nr:hypothetical protein B0T25DRAFT_543720 [Lasiosphaeria hispida]